MKHIISNPHNGSDVQAHGVTLAAGHEIEVAENTAHALVNTFGFLLHRTADGKAAYVGAKAKKLKGTLSWAPHNAGTDELPAPDEVKHIVDNKAPKPPRKPAAKKKAGKKK